LHDVWPSPWLVHYIYVFGGSCPITEFCQEQRFSLGGQPSRWASAHIFLTTVNCLQHGDMPLTNTHTYTHTHTHSLTHSLTAVYKLNISKQVVIFDKAASPLQADDSNVFARWHQCATPSNTVPRTHQTQHHKLHLNQYSHFCTAHGKEFLYFTIGHSFSPSKLPLCTRDPDPT